ncbi:MAG: type II secretion system protein GspD [Sulfitobacter sp.]|nr:MAG: type II secretion system protein GspD [Sulfitobacter sp.]
MFTHNNYVKVSKLVCLLLLPTACTPLWEEDPQVGTTHVRLESGPSTANQQKVQNTLPGPSKVKPVLPETLPHKSVIIKGSGKFVNGSDDIYNNTPGATSVKEGTIFNFVDADIRHVIKVVLSDMLGYNYFIDPSIEGKITLTTSRPLAKSNIIPTLEALLSANNLALIFDNGLYRVLEANKAARLGRLSQLNGGNASPSGYGIRIFSLKFAAANEIQKIISSIVKDANILHTDNHRNILIVSGNGPQLRAVQDAVNTFDVDWLKGLSYAVLTPNFVDAETLIKELNTLFNEEQNPISGLVRLIAIPRINTILAISSQPAYLSQIEHWVGLLDKEVELTKRHLNTYFVQHGKAVDLADVLNKLFSQGVYEFSNSNSDSYNNQSPSLQKRTKGEFNIHQNQSVKKESDKAALVRKYRPYATSKKDKDRPSFIADERSNALLILATSQEYKSIKQTLRQLDIAPDQVLIEATIVEVSLTDQLRYGVQWFLNSGNSSFILSEAATGTASAIFPGFAYTFANNNISAVLNALGEVTTVKVISSPKLMALNNQTARLQVGDEVPIATQASVSSTTSDSPLVNTIEYKDTGVILEVTPRISVDGNVILEISQEVSDVIKTTASGIDSPTIQQRKVKSTVIIESGKTVALGGLIRDNRSETESGIPILKDIPLLGNLFKSTEETVRQTELLIFITPTIARNTKDALAITKHLKRSLSTLKDNLFKK